MIVLGLIMIIIGIILTAVGIIADIENWECSKTAIGMFASLFIAFGTIALCSTVKKITPMDVYQGNTTLEYTIRDNEVVDSVVVWKIEKSIEE